VNKKTRYLLNWILIALLAMLPLRNVMALAQVNCEMHDQSSIEMIDHSMHAMHSSSSIDNRDAVVADNCCCCDNGMDCTGDCSLGLSASLIMQPVITVPTINQSRLQTFISTSLVLREISPPVRPPENFQI
jgi:hypothetical protein